jgi:hypothetical protein
MKIGCNLWATKLPKEAGELQFPRGEEKFYPSNLNGMCPREQKATCSLGNNGMSPRQQKQQPPPLLRALLRTSITL